MTDLPSGVSYPLEEKKKGPGRPIGSRTVRGMLKRFQEVYDKLEPMLNDEQQAYYKAVFSGRAPYDALKLGELFMLQFALYTTDVLDHAIDNKKISQDIAQTVAQYRMGLKDIEEMQRKRDEVEAKKETNERVIDPTRQSSESRLDSLIERATKASPK